MSRPRASFWAATAQFLTGTAAAQAFAMVAALLTARLIGPEAFGAFVVFASLLVAAPHLHLGLRSALEREVPLVAAQGKQAWGRELVQAAWAGTWGIAVGVGLLCVAAGLLVGGPVGMAWLAAAVAVPVRQELDLRIALARVQEDAAWASRIMVATSLGPFGGALVPALLGWDAWVCPGGAVGMCLGALVTRGGTGSRVRPAWTARAGRTLWRVGIPIYVVVVIDVALRITDRALVLWGLGQEALGQLGLASTAAWTPWLLAFAAGFVLLPRLLRSLGQGGDPWPLMVQGGKQLGLVVGGSCVIGIGIGPPVIDWLLPEYGDAGRVLVAFVPGVMARSVAHFGMLLLIAQGRLRPLLWVQGLSLVLNVAGDLAAIQLGFGVVGVAWATTAALWVQGASIVAVACTEGPRAPARRHAVGAGLPALVVLLVAAGSHLLLG